MSVTSIGKKMSAEEVALVLSAAHRNSNPNVFLQELMGAVEWAGIRRVAKRVESSSASLRQAFALNAEPTYELVLAVLRAMDFSVQIERAGMPVLPASIPESPRSATDELAVAKQRMFERLRRSVRQDGTLRTTSRKKIEVASAEIDALRSGNMSYFSFSRMADLLAQLGREVTVHATPGRGMDRRGTRCPLKSSSRSLA